MTDKQRILAEMDLLKQQLLFIETAERMSNPIQEEPVSGNIDFEKELYKAFGQINDFTLGMQIAKWFYDMGRNSKDSQEPVSDDLEDAAEDYCKSTLVGSHSIKKNAFKAGAQWQKEKDQNK